MDGSKDNSRTGDSQITSGRKGVPQRGTQDYSSADVVIVGGGPAGLACAISLKKQRPGLDVCVIEKAASPGNHNLSGAVLEHHAVEMLLGSVLPGWADTPEAKALLGRRVEKDDLLFMPSSKTALNISFAIRLAKSAGIGFGQMSHHGDYICSISALTVWLDDIARRMGVEVLTGFAAEDIELDRATGLARSVKLVDQGLDKHGNRQPNYVAGEVVRASCFVLAEGCDGLVSERFIEKAGLQRRANQLYSIGVRELIKVSDSRYAGFGDNRVVHAMGYPLWTPLLGPGMFGGGIMYSMGQNTIAVGMIAGLDWKYYDFNPQDALVLFKEHRFVKRFIDGGSVVEAGAKMIPEGGFYAVARDPDTGSIGRGNVLLIGDAAGFVNMLKIKGLHNAIISGLQAGLAIADGLEQNRGLASFYTRRLLSNTAVMAEMESAKNFRQAVARFGPLAGMPLSVLAGMLPELNVEKDYKALTQLMYRYKRAGKFDKDMFTAMAGTDHRDEQPSHLKIQDENICINRCMKLFDAPCITFCPAGVYETVCGRVKPANALNCLHCKTCQRKCPFDNIRWVVPEGGGGPKYKGM